MAVSLNTFHVELYEEYLEEASFLYEQRMTLPDDPEITWRDIADFEDRFEAQIDGLVVGGEAALTVSIARAADGDVGELHAATRLFCRQRRQDLVDNVIDATDIGANERMRAMIDALKHELPDEWQSELIANLTGEDIRQRRIAAEVIGFRRIRAGAELTRALAMSTGSTATALIWAIGRIRETSAVSRLTEDLSHADEERCAAAALALLRIGDPHVAGACLDRLVSANWPMLPLGLCGSRATAQHLLGFASARRSPESMIALAMLGDVSAVEELLVGLDDDTTNAYAALGLNLITGADLYEEAFIPEALDEDELFADEREKLKNGQPPYPDGQTPGTTIVRLSGDTGNWRAWWQRHHSRFTPGLRYRNGSPYGPAVLLESLRSEKTPALIRKIIAEELVVRYGIDVRFETDMTVRDQWQTLSGLERRILSDTRSIEAGAWYLGGRKIA